MVVPGSKLLFAVLLVALAGCGGKKDRGDGWHCFAFTYDGRQRVDCQKSKQACEETKEEIKEIATDLGECLRSREVYCFRPGDAERPPVCLPTMDWCTRTRELHATGVMKDVESYSNCGPPDAIPPLPDYPGDPKPKLGPE